MEYTAIYTRYDDYYGRVVSIEHRGTLPEVFDWIESCARPRGPNGPLWSMDLLRPDGTEVPEDGWAQEIEAAGYRPVYVRDWADRLWLRLGEPIPVET